MLVVYFQNKICGLNSITGNRGYIKISNLTASGRIENVWSDVNHGYIQCFLFELDKLDHWFCRWVQINRFSRPDEDTEH